MTDYPKHVLLEEVTRLGNYHSFWLPGTPIDGEFWFLTKAVDGGMPVNEGHVRGPRGYTSGGPWLMKKQELIREGPSFRVFTNANQLAYDGRFAISYPPDDRANLTTLSQESVHADVMSFGATALKRLRPDKPDFNQALALLELKDVIPHLASSCATITRKVRDALKRRGLKPRKMPHSKASSREMVDWWEYPFLNKTAEYHLAVQFGWLPLLSDILGTIDNFFSNEKKVQQILRDAGKPVRRSGVLHTESSELGSGSWNYPGQYNHPDMQPVFVTQCYNYGDWPTSSYVKTYERKVWFSGKSRYYLPGAPNGGVNLDEVRRRTAGIGKFITPSNLYNLIPWSWMVDYFTDLGDFIEGADGGIGDLWIIDYAYIMDQRTITDKYRTEVGLRGEGGSTFRAHAFRTRTETHKSRVNASLFGWGLSQDDLSPKQLGILGAIGSSRL